MNVIISKICRRHAGYVAMIMDADSDSVPMNNPMHRGIDKAGYSLRNWYPTCSVGDDVLKSSQIENWECLVSRS